MRIVRAVRVGDPSVIAACRVASLAIAACLVASVIAASLVAVAYLGSSLVAVACSDQPLGSLEKRPHY